MSNQFSIKNGMTKQGITLDANSLYDVYSDNIDYSYDPALTGFVHVYIQGLPQTVMNIVQQETGITSVDQAFWFLAKSATVPTQTIQDQLFDGMIQIPTPGKLEDEHTCSISFLDTKELICTKILRALFNVTRPHVQSLDNNIISAHSNNVSVIGNSVTKSNYSVNALIFTVDETFTNVTYSKLLVGLYPRTMPNDILQADYTDVLAYRFSQSFSVVYSISDSTTDLLATQALQKMDTFINLYQ